MKVVCAIVLLATSLASSVDTCGGELTNGTRPGDDYASLKMQPPADAATDCRDICCKDPKCVFRTD